MIQDDVSNVDPRTVLVILMNVSSSIGIVFLNKWLFQYLAFPFSTFVTFCHFCVTALGLWICARVGVFQAKSLPFKEVFLLSLSFCGFVVLTNLSLQLNSVGFYQVAKTLTTPVIMFIQYQFYGKTQTFEMQMSLLVVIAGVIITVLTDFKLNLNGSAVAALAVFITSCYQIWVGEFQKSLNTSSMQLLYYQAPLSAAMLLFIVPFFDDVNEIIAFEWDPNTVIVLGLSCLAALSVNLSIFLLIGRTSAITYNVVGHFKLTIVIVGGFVLFAAPLSIPNLVGVLVTYVGLLWHTHLKLKPSPAAAVTEKELTEKEKEVQGTAK